MVAFHFVAGLALLVLGAEALVRGASRLAAAVGISPLVVGLTVVAFGTSSPELAVSVQAARAVQPAIALGNVVGSNIFNVLFILGLSALVSPLTVSQKLVRWDVPLLIGVSLLVLALGLDGRIGRGEGLLLLAILLLYTAFSIVQSRREQAEIRREYAVAFGVAPPVAAPGWLSSVAAVAVGLGLLALGARWLLDAAVVVARALGLGEAVIALTLVAAGTSLPELVTSVLASLRGERDIAVGNVVGSNLFNLLGVLGAASAAVPGGIAVPEGFLAFDLPVMVAVALACLPIFFTGGEISRWEGALLLAYQGAYTAYLVLSASGSQAARVLAAAVLYFALPWTFVTLLVLALRGLRKRG